MSWRDFIESAGGMAADAVVSHGDDAAGIGEGALRHAPGIGSLMSLGTGARHYGSALYDGATGDRDGAISHVVQANYNFLNAAPPVNAVTGLTDLALGLGNGVDEGGSAMRGENSHGVPGDVGEGLGQAAVEDVRGLFGEDDSNWIASGDTRTGTRQGESMAGYALANGPAAPYGAAYGYGRAQLEGHPDGPTSGVGDQGVVGDATEDMVRRAR